MKQRILFVCLGNICRSPAAEGIMQHLVDDNGLRERFEIDSAGTYSGHAGELPDARMRQAAAQRGYRLTHHARPLQEKDFDDFDLIVAMDDANYERICRMAPSRAYIEKVTRMVNFCRNHPQWAYVPDPYYEGHEGFELVLDLLEDGCKGLLEQLSITDS